MGGSDSLRKEFTGSKKPELSPASVHNPRRHEGKRQRLAFPGFQTTHESEADQVGAQQSSSATGPGGQAGKWQQAL